jgi:hypothetical protein
LCKSTFAFSLQNAVSIAYKGESFDLWLPHNANFANRSIYLTDIFIYLLKLILKIIIVIESILICHGHWHITLIFLYLILNIFYKSKIFETISVIDFFIGSFGHTMDALTNIKFFVIQKYSIILYLKI